jgi:hypothetical protein
MYYPSKPKLIIKAKTNHVEDKQKKQKQNAKRPSI